MKNRLTVVVMIIFLIINSCGKKEVPLLQEVGMTHYTCPMHPQIIQEKPGVCPICSMVLVKLNMTTSRNTIRLTETQLKLANITTTLVRLQNIGSNTILTGKLKFDETQTEVISSRVQGRIETLFVQEIGQHIVKGQALYQLYSDQLFTLQHDYILALNQLDVTKDDRYQTFATSSEKKLLLLGMTKSQIENIAKEKVVNSRTTFYAPVSGVVKSIEVSQGQYVSEGLLLYSIEKLDNLWMEADLYPGESNFIKIGDEVKVSINNMHQSSISGKIIFISPEYREGSQVTIVRASIANTKREFQPGMQANIILIHATKKTIAVPLDAVIRDAFGNHIWLMQKDGSFESRRVKTGLENSQMVEITEGLTEKENVVITGAYRLHSESILKYGVSL